MPLYTYECEECGVRFDARQKFSDDPMTVCPECGGHIHRVPQAVGIVFKGSGWYAKDSKGSNNLAVPPKKDTENAKPESGKTETGSSSDKKADAPAAAAD
jgi:putative FmdB family regulatory protein